LINLGDGEKEAGPAKAMAYLFSEAEVPRFRGGLEYSYPPAATGGFLASAR